MSYSVGEAGKGASLGPEMVKETLHVHYRDSLLVRSLLAKVKPVLHLLSLRISPSVCFLTTKRLRI